MLLHGLTFWNIQYNFAKFLPTLGYDLKIDSSKFQENRFIIDGEIDEKHALQNYQNKCGPGYIVRTISPSTMFRVRTQHVSET